MKTVIVKQVVCDKEVEETFENVSLVRQGENGDLCVSYFVLRQNRSKKVSQHFNQKFLRGWGEIEEVSTKTAEMVLQIS